MVYWSNDRVYLFVGMCGVIGNMPLCHSGVRSSSLPRSAVYKNRNRVRTFRVLEETIEEKVCVYCHNHEFDDILEVYHLKGIILEFDSNTTIGEINSEDNLIWLCPNHHKMLEM